MAMIRQPLSEAEARKAAAYARASHRQEGIYITDEEEKDTVLYLMGKISLEESVNRALRAAGYQEILK